MSIQTRQPAGTPVGGQYATSARAESALSLTSERPPLVETSRGVFEVVNATSETLPSDRGISRTVFHMAGRPDVRAGSGMAALRMQRSEQDDVTGAKLEQLAEKRSKATVLLAGRAGDVQAVEGTLFRNGDAIGLIAKGSRDKGRWLTGRDVHTRVLGVEPGYGKAPVLAERFRDHAEKVPQVEPIGDLSDIPVVEGFEEPPSDIAAVFVLEHPGFDGDQDGRGSLFFVTDFQPGDGSHSRSGQGVVNGYGVYPPESGLESEHGSLYVSDLKRWGGRVAGYQAGAHTFRDVMGLAKQADAYRDGDIEAVWESVRAASR